MQRCLQTDGKGNMSRKLADAAREYAWLLKEYHDMRREVFKAWEDLEAQARPCDLTVRARQRLNAILHPKQEVRCYEK